MKAISLPILLHASRGNTLPAVLRGALLSILLVAPLKAQTWSAVGDFSLSANPNGAWTYGSKTSPAAASHCVFGVVSGCAGIATVWEFGAVSACSSALCYPYTGIAVGQGTDWLFMHPRNEAAVRYNTTRFTAPSPGTYQVDASFRLAPGGFNPIDAYVVVSSATPSLQSVILSSAGVVHAFGTAIETLAAGDTIDFVIGDDVNGDYGDWGQMQATIQLVSAAAEPRDLVLFDADLDGDLDIATANYATNDVSLRLNDGTGAFGAPIAVSLGAGALGPVAIAAGDLDNDGRADDIAVACIDSSTVVLVTNPGIIPALASSSTGLRPLDVGIGDLDGNPIDDVVIASEGDPLTLGRIYVCMNGGPAVPTIAGGRFRKLAVVDINGDGDTDVIALDSPVLVLHNSFAQSGIFALGFGPILNVGSTIPASGLCCRDFDGDGDMDVAVVRPTLFPPSQDLRIFLNTVTGLTPNFTVVDIATNGAFAADLACGDLEGDSLAGSPLLDFVHVNLGGGVTIRHGFQAGAFAATSTATAGANPVALAIGDLNEDGCDDIAIANQGSTQASTDVTVILSTVPSLTQLYGTGCGGPMMSAVGTPTLGASAFGIRVTGAVGFAPALLLYSTSSNDLPLLPSACRLLVGDPIGQFLFFTDGSGEETFSIGIPSAPLYLGLDLYFQWAVIHMPGGAFADTLDLSNGLRIQIGS